MTKKNAILSLFVVLFLCACAKKTAHSSYKKSLASNEEQTKELAKNNNNYALTNILGQYSLNSKDIDKIDRPKPDATLESKQKNNSKHNLSAKEMIKIEREGRRNTYDKTRPPEQKKLDFRNYNQPFQSFPTNY